MKKILTLLLLVINLSVYSQSIWFTEKINVKASDKVKFNLEYEDRFSDFSHQYDHTDIGISYKLFKDFNLNFNSRVVREFDSSDIKMEYMPHFSFDYKYGNFSISPKIEFRFLDNSRSLRFRNKICFTMPLKKRLNLYLADEIFIVRKLNANRAYCGFLIKYDTVEFILYYLSNSKFVRTTWTVPTGEYDVWSNENVIGLTTKLSF